MTALTSSVTKFAALALSLGMAWATVDAVALGFQAPAFTTTVVELPTVVVVGHRDTPVALQSAVKTTQSAS